MLVPIGSLKVGQLGITGEGRVLLRVRCQEQNAAVDLGNPSIVHIWAYNSLSPEVTPYPDGEEYVLRSKAIPGK